MTLLLGLGVVALLVFGVGRWMRPSKPTSPSPVAPQGETVAPAGVATTGAGSLANDPFAEARRLRALLLSRQVPQTFIPWQVVPEPGEVFFFDVAADYERFYGQDVGFRPANGFYFGSPAFILAGLAVSGVTNAQRRRAAAAAGATQWRELASARVLVSNHRLLCLVGGQWISFHYAAMTAVYPEVTSGVLVCEFTGVPPLRLQGPDVPIAAVMTVFATHGLAALADHPSLQPLG